ncbi:MAG: hypothetical protein KC729_10615 [Candidatus Eisenbacteria bacterium]|uniref:Nucleotidyl transferase domain-containing protein n=1 Tax=Eiseniibacteriota bacterium TaxID=2212470 RepID=A0A956RP23_UNCEI|nr:hypothetical protein [Candidatus Eisenbacteria bacterium]
MSPGARRFAAESVPVFLLCGGLGTRLRRVDARPKAVIPVAGVPFVLYLLRLLGIQGFREIHLLVGHGAERVLTTLGLDPAPEAGAGTSPPAAPANEPPFEADLPPGATRQTDPARGPADEVVAGGSTSEADPAMRTSPSNPLVPEILRPLTLCVHREPEPMGTGGALSLARGCFGDYNLILNADSYAESIYPDLWIAHAELGEKTADGLTLLAVWQDDRSDYGGLALGAAALEGEEEEATDAAILRRRTHSVTSFLEKGITGPGWINGGVYLAGRGALERLPDGPSSLERKLLPELVRDSRLYALRSRCFFRDIGTPDRLRAAQQEFRRIRSRFDDASR